MTEVFIKRYGCWEFLWFFDGDRYIGRSWGWEYCQLQLLVAVGVAVGSAVRSGWSGSVDGSISTTYCWIDWRESNLNWGSQRLAIASSTVVEVSGVDR